MELKASIREKLGKKTRSLRKQGFVPVELYGHGVANIHLSIPIKDMRNALRSEGDSTLLYVTVEKESIRRPVLVYEVQENPLNGEMLQVDLYQVKLDEKIKTKVSLEFSGESPAIKAGGVLVKSMQDIEIEALPADLPSKIEVLITSIKEIGQSIYVRDLQVSPRVRIVALPETVVGTVVNKGTEEEEAAQIAKTAGVEKVVVETQEKKAERDAKKEEGKVGDEKKGAEPQPAKK